MGTYKCSFNTDSNLLVLTFQIYTEPSAEPTEMYWPSGLKAARDQSQPTLKPSALQEKICHNRRFIENKSEPEICLLSWSVSQSTEAKTLKKG
jgi:hypothetical protein